MKPTVVWMEGLRVGRKQKTRGTYSGARFCIVEQWFPVNAKLTIQHKEQVNLQQRSSVAEASVSRLLYRALSGCMVSANLICADWSTTASRTRLSRQLYSKPLQYHQLLYHVM